LAEFANDGIALAMLLGADLVSATADLPHAAAVCYTGDLWGWMRPQWRTAHGR
jgi:hypothetical protein